MSDPRLFMRPRRPIPSRPHLLLTNDDGIEAPGLAALAEALAPLADLTVVAPRHEQSGMSHALSVFKDLRLERWERDGKAGWWALDGTPADCVKVGLVEMRHRRPIDMVVAGVNRGINAGVDIHYSGTVAAAREGTLLGAPSIAVSLYYRDEGHRPYEVAGRVAAEVFQMVKRHGLPPGVLLNVNVPPVPYAALRGWAVTRMGNSGYQDHYVTLTEEAEAALAAGDDGNHDNDAAGPDDEHVPARPGTRQNVGKGRLPTAPAGLGHNVGPKSKLDAEPDDLVVERDMVSITPLQVDQTAYDFLDELRGWL
jgi:5'-nucleotidase